MFQIQDILIPARFICYILQVLLTISIGIACDDFVNSERYPELKAYKTKYWVFFLFLWF